MLVATQILRDGGLFSVIPLLVKFLFTVLFYRRFRLCITKAHRAKPIPLRLHEPKAPSGRELPTKSGEGERVTIKSI